MMIPLSILRRPSGYALPSPEPNFWRGMIAGSIMVFIIWAAVPLVVLWLAGVL